MFNFNNAKFWQSAAYRALLLSEQALTDRLGNLELRVWQLENPKKFSCGDIVTFQPKVFDNGLVLNWSGSTRIMTLEPTKCKILGATPTLYGWKYKTIEVDGCTIREH